ncbi:XdhC family protein [uncultured Shewanella sp.]|uniref:XdhC family protein n=1 Tax=uncultured Shewanella sp. TaxID=173975 RepID=UPI0037049761
MSLIPVISWAVVVFVHIMMVSLNKSNNYLCLVSVHDALMRGHAGVYQIDVVADGTPVNKLSGHFVEQGAELSTSVTLKSKTRAVVDQDTTVLHIPVRPPVHIGIFGGGLDAQPIAQMAQTLGWKVSVFDERTAYARTYDFPGCQIIKYSALIPLLQRQVLCVDTTASTPSTLR